jgi:hypothetical protein
MTLHKRLSKQAAASALVLAVCFLASSCSKDILTTEPLTPLAPTSADANAGTWKMIVLTSPTQIAVAAPAGVSDPSYQNELTISEAAQKAATPDQATAIQYWSAGGILRWNEILRELVARADLPPAPNDDGTYPAPDPNNPFNYPTYPFSNPPYAVRAYSYVAVAQYEALKVAWFYKFLYNRPAPHTVDKKISQMMPTTNVPSYPSEDAVEAGVNATLLAALFPTSITEINQKVSEQQQAALISGRASQSDIAAGFQLGQAVAAIFLARAKNDGMKNAGGNATIWAQMAANATALGQTPWISQELPLRPPMLPLFGQVQGWMMTPANILSVRPQAPPTTSSDQMNQELDAVKSAVENITRDQLATVYKWNDGANSVTPPGHWNEIAVPYLEKAKFSEVRTARALALLNMAMHDAGVACWDTKYAYFNPRPSQLDPTIKTMIGLPNFPSYVSGHSDFSAAADTVLSYLFPDGASYFDSQRDEAAMSRLYGGIHYPADIKNGVAQGKAVGAFTVNFAKTDGAN